MYVGNGASLLCSLVARSTKLFVQECKFLIDLHILDIHGPDVILGMAWLESLGIISADFVGKTLKFMLEGQPSVIHGMPPSPRRISLHSLALLTSHSTANNFYEIVQLEPDQPASVCSLDIAFPVDTPAEILAVLEQFTSIFQIPTGMSPRRVFDHHIHLLPHTKQVNMRPYRYPYFQKNEIE